MGLGVVGSTDEQHASGTDRRGCALLLTPDRANSARQIPHTAGVLIGLFTSFYEHHLELQDSYG